MGSDKAKQTKKSDLIEKFYKMIISDSGSGMCLLYKTWMIRKIFNEKSVVGGSPFSQDDLLVLLFTWFAWRLGAEDAHWFSPQLITEQVPVPGSPADMPWS